MAEAYRIELLGGLRVVPPGDSARPPITHFRTRKTALLLAYLALFSGRQHGREELIERFWPDMSMAAARDNLSGCLSSLRRQFDKEEPSSGSVGASSFLSANRESVWLNLSAESVDVAAFDRALDAAADRTMSLAARRNLLETALRLYRGPLLPDVYEDWALSEQTRLAQRYTFALATLAELQEGMGDRERALTTARRARQADPFAETACRTEMRLLASLGQLEAARGAYQEFVAHLRQELDCAPSPALQVFFRDLEQIEPAGVVNREADLAALPPNAAVPETPVPPPSGTGKARLPAPLSRFWGREAEIEHLVRVLKDDNRPCLLTLTGPGGIGKTHLSLVTAAQLARAEPRLRLNWVPLADISDERHFLPTLQQALGMSGESAASDPIEALSERLSPGKGDVGVVVLLDNLEHLLGDDSTLARVPALIRALLERTPGLTFLTTSRRILGLEGEQEFALGPLPVPQTTLSSEEPLSEGVLREMRMISSVGLFTERVRLIRPDFVLTAANAADVAAICQRLGGAPLALEMAAGWARSLSVRQIRERLDTQILALQSRRRDLPARHSSLRATMQWSWELLDAGLREFFLHLCVFRGGFTSEAAEAVAGDGDPSSPDLLARLQEHSLLMRRQGEVEEENGVPERYVFLEPIREWGVEKLMEDEAAYQAVRLRHARFFHQTAVRHNSDISWFRGDEQNSLLAIDTLFKTRSDAAEEAERVGEGLYLTYTLAYAWYQHGMHRMAYQALTAGRERYECSVLGRGFVSDSLLYGNVLFFAGGHARCLGLFDQAESCVQEAQKLYAALDDRKHIAYCEGERGMLATERGDFDEALRRFARTVEVGRDIADLDLIGRGLLHLGKTEHQLGKRDDAYTHFAEALETLRQDQSWLPYTEALLMRCLLLLDEERWERAQSDVASGLEVAVRIGNIRATGLFLGVAAALAARQKRVLRALRLFAAADRFIRESGTPLLPSEAQARLKAAGGNAWQFEVSAADAETAKTQGRADSLESAIDYARQFDAD